MLSPTTGELSSALNVVLVAAGETVSEYVCDWEPTKLVSPSYVAVIESSSEVVYVVSHVASSGFDWSSGFVHKVPAVSTNDTEPVGVPDPGAVTATVAV